MITRHDFRENAAQFVDGFLIKQLFGAGLTWLDANKDRVNQLNVFPVPDGDTGTNMFLTMRNAYMQVQSVQDNHVGRLSRAIADGALMGARGNSGVILSQLFAGMARALDGHERLNAALFAEACREAVEAAYKAVEKPVEGTILTVSRSMMEAVVSHSEQEPNLIALLKRMVFAGRASLRRTPDLLPVLKKAGVVDSGGAGLVYIFEGMLRALCGKNLEIAPIAGMMAPEMTVAQPRHVETWEDALVPDDALGYGYDVQFLMRGNGLNINRVRTDIQAMGWSTLVVGDDQLIKVHVHVHNPGDPLGYAIGAGASLDDIVVENMQAQYETYVKARGERAPTIRTDVVGVAVITVASGEGLQQLFTEQLNAAHIITGGQTMNPSTGEFIEIIEALPNTEIILLPNNRNVLLAAQQAAERASAGKTVRVVPSLSIPQGITAMFEYINLCSNADAPCPLDDIVGAMNDALENVVTVEVTNATRDADLEGVRVRAGQYIGLINDQLVIAGDDVETTTRELLQKANAADYERITVYYGRDVDAKSAGRLVDSLRAKLPAQEFEIVPGGQALYPYIISVE